MCYLYCTSLEEDCTCLWILIGILAGIDFYSLGLFGCRMLIIFAWMGSWNLFFPYLLSMQLKIQDHTCRFFTFFLSFLKLNQKTKNLLFIKIYNLGNHCKLGLFAKLNLKYHFNYIVKSLWLRQWMLYIQLFNWYKPGMSYQFEVTLNLFQKNY